VALVRERTIPTKSPNNTSKWQMGFNSAFKGLNFFVCQVLPFQIDIVISLSMLVPVTWPCVNKRTLWYLAEEDLQPLTKQSRTKWLIIVDRCSSLFVTAHELPRCNVGFGATKLVRRKHRSVFTIDYTFSLVLSLSVLFQWSVQIKTTWVLPLSAFRQRFIKVRPQLLDWKSASLKSFTHNTGTEIRQT
jgi:hypothetical protein